MYYYFGSEKLSQFVQFSSTRFCTSFEALKTDKLGISSSPDDLFIWLTNPRSKGHAGVSTLLNGPLEVRADNRDAHTPLMKLSS